MQDFFVNHSLLILIGLTICPRITLLLGGFVTGGLLWWLGFLFTPHFLVAVLAVPYFDTNPFLVVMAWMFAFTGTSIEGKRVRRLQGRGGPRRGNRRRGFKENQMEDY